MNNKKPLFDLGQIVATPACLEALQATGETPDTFLHRHVTGDHGSICDEDRQLNEQALVHGDRIMSAYMLADARTKIWIITEATGDDGRRASSCLLLPADY